MNMVHILGGAQTDFERNWTKEGKGMIAILSEVVSDGLANVPDMRQHVPHHLLQSMQLRPKSWQGSMIWPLSSGGN